jgi:septum formation protein
MPPERATGAPGAPGAGLRLTRPLCLASASPRRKALLEQFGLRFAVQGSPVDESPRPGEAAEALAVRLAREKAGTALARFPDHLILAGDTVVELDGRLLGKPESPQDAARMVAALSGRTHRVVTGYCLLDGPTGGAVARAVETRVTFRALPQAWVRWYSHLPESLDKAGAYGIQGIGGAMVSRIEGSFANVVGLPVEAVIWDMLEQGWLEW